MAVLTAERRVRVTRDASHLKITELPKWDDWRLLHPAVRFVLPMNTQTHPGQGLSLSQLIFAFNEELKCTAYYSPYVSKDKRGLVRDALETDLLTFSHSFTFDEVSQLDQDTSMALANLREWRNSFIPINRIPLDILSLVPTYLSSQRDRLRASFVCRHWRRIFLQRAELWSELFLSKGKVYVETLLERAKGSALEVFVGYWVTDNIMRPLTPHIKQIRCLNFPGNQWVEIRRFSEADPGPLPLLHTLTINVADKDDPSTLPIALPHRSLFSNAINIKAFRLHSRPESSPSLRNFTFPNLVSFELSVTAWGMFPASQLFDFLESSPMLRTVHVKIIEDVSLDGVPKERIVILPNAEDFSLTVSDRRCGYEVATRISCPSAGYLSFTHMTEESQEEIFPAQEPWNAILRHYTRNPVEEVSLEIRFSPIITCILTFRSPDATTFELSFKVVGDDGDEDGSRSDLPITDMHNRVFTLAARTIRDHPQLASVKRLHICHGSHFIGNADISHLVNEIGQLFKVVGPLDKLTIHNCDLQPYFHTSIGIPEDDIEEPLAFPATKEFTVSHPVELIEEECVGMIQLARLQHSLGIPFERVTFCGESVPQGLEEGLKPWVSSVECRRQDDLWDTGDGPWNHR